MIKSSPECGLHDDPLAPDRRVVRDHLHDVTKVQVEVLLEDNRRAVWHQPESEFNSYEPFRAGRAEQYTKVQSTLDAFPELDGLATTYVTTLNSPSRYEKPILRNPFIPVGEYGRAPARRLLHGILDTLAMHELHHDAISSLATTTRERNSAVRYHTFQGNAMQDAEKGSAVTTQVGIVSVGQALALLTMDRVEGTTWDDLAREIVESELLTEFVRRIGPNLLPQMIIYGHFKHLPVRRVGGAYLALSADLKRVADINKKQFSHDHVDAQKAAPLLFEELKVAHEKGSCPASLREAVESNHRVLSSGTTCPAANRGGEITQVARRILEVAAYAPRAVVAEPINNFLRHH